VKARVLGFALALLATSAFAHEVDGKWTGSLDTPNGPIPVNYTFKADGMKLTGSTSAPDGSSIAIKDGKVDGEKIAFAIDLDFGQGPVTFTYTGVVSKGEIKIHSEFMGMPFDFTVKKAI